MAFAPGGQCLPYDWVDEGKLLLFVMEEVVSRAPRSGQRLIAARKRKAAGADDAPRKRRHQLDKKDKEDEEEEGGLEDAAGRQLLTEQAAADGESEDDDAGIVLMYNTVRGYISAINELWAHQVAQKLHNAPRPQNVAIKVHPLSTLPSPPLPLLPFFPLFLFPPSSSVLSPGIH